MSTHASIAKLEKDGTVTSIYCHFDGDIDTVGRILVKHYETPEKIEELLSMGDVQSLGEKIEAPEAVKRFGLHCVFDDEFSKLPDEEKNRLKDELYSFKCSTFFTRDGKEDTPARKFYSLRNWFESANESYNYLFDIDNTWKLVTHRGRIKQIHLTELSDNLN